jgi:hypothetical protein
MQLHEEKRSAEEREMLDPHTRERCVEACVEAEVSCVACADASLGEADLDQLRRCIRSNLDCADVAGATARMLARRLVDARLLRAQVELCARACAAAADGCEEHAGKHDHCRQCGEACREAAERCGAVLRELPDAWGQTHPKAPSANQAE